MNPEIMDFFSKIIYDEIGIVYDQNNAFALENRLKSIVSALELGSVEELYRSCQKKMDVEIKSFLLDTATNNETSFFRDRNVFDAIQNNIILDGLRNGKKHFSIWSAACSAGQEVYSLVFMLETMKLSHPQLTYSILGSDISSKILAQAIAGEYSQLEVQRGLSAGDLVKYLEKSSDTSGIPGRWRIKDSFRSNLTFRQLNLLKPFPLIGPFDIVMCRNVLIYQDQEHREDILRRIHKLIVPGGAILLGGAERITGMDELFKAEILGRAVVYHSGGRPKGIRSVS